MIERERLLPHTMARLAVEQPEGLAAVDVEGRRLTHREFHDENLRWAAVLLEAGVDRGDFVATMIPNSFEAYHAWLGLSWMRAVEVPLNPAYRGHLLSHALNAATARTAVVNAEFLPNLLEVADELSHLQTVIVPDSDELPTLPWRAVPAKQQFLDAKPAEGLDGPDCWDLEAVIYTSGTSGPAKPVLAPWGTIPCGLDVSGIRDLIEPGEALFAMFPAFHQSGKSALYIAIHAGGHIVLRRQFSPTTFLDDVRRFEITGAQLIGAMAQFLLAQPERDDDADAPLRRVQLLPCVPEVDTFRRRFGVEVSTMYGSTELSSVTVSPGFNIVDPSSCGRLRRDRYGIEARIVDPYDREVPVGEVGELVVRHAEPWTMTQGYLGMPEATLESMRNGSFHTGDALRCDEEGNYFFVDRLKDAVRRRGENISSFDVETFVNQHADVVESAAVGLPSEEASTEDELKVCVVIRPDATPTPEDLYDFLVERMPKFMLPRYIEFVEALPRTVTQKVQKARLRAESVTASTWDRTRRSQVPSGRDR